MLWAVINIYECLCQSLWLMGVFCSPCRYKNTLQVKWYPIKLDRASSMVYAPRPITFTGLMFWYRTVTGLKVIIAWYFKCYSDSDNHPGHSHGVFKNKNEPVDASTRHSMQVSMVTISPSRRSKLGFMWSIYCIVQHVVFIIQTVASGFENGVCLYQTSP